MHANEPKSLVLRDDDKHEVKMNQNSSYNSNDCRDNNLMSTNYNQSSNDQDNEDDDVDNFLNNVRQEETTSLPPNTMDKHGWGNDTQQWHSQQDIQRQFHRFHVFQDELNGLLLLLLDVRVVVVLIEHGVLQRLPGSGAEEGDHHQQDGEHDAVHEGADQVQRANDGWSDLQVEAKTTPTKNRHD